MKHSESKPETKPPNPIVKEMALIKTASGLAQIQVIFFDLPDVAIFNYSHQVEQAMRASFLSGKPVVGEMGFGKQPKKLIV